MSLSAKPYLRSVEIQPDAVVEPDAYPFSIPAVRELATLEPHPDVTFFVGENGAGKSTVLEAIAVGLGMPAEGGTRNVHREQQEVSPLHRYLKLVKGYKQPRFSYFLRAESLFNVFTYLDQLPGGDPSLHLRSHGEAFMDVMQKFSGDGLYLLDEPEAALSPNRQLAALAVIDRLVKRARSSSSPPIRRSCWPIRARRSCCSTRAASARSTTRTPSTTRSRATF
jgi:predicted ATPase